MKKTKKRFSLIEIIVWVVVLSAWFFVLISTMRTISNNLNVTKWLFKQNFQRWIFYENFKNIKNDYWFETLKSLTVDPYWAWSCIQYIKKESYCNFRPDLTIDIENCTDTKTEDTQKLIWIISSELYNEQIFTNDLLEKDLNWVFQNKICWELINEWEWNEWIEYTVYHEDKEAKLSTIYNIYLSSMEYEAWK